jgi:hypothetical protein
MTSRNLVSASGREGSRRRPIGWGFWLLLLLFVALQIAYVVTTNRGLSVPGGCEANPIMSAFQTQLGAAWWLPKAAMVAWVLVAATRTRRRWPLAFAVSYCGVVLAVNLAPL